MFYTVTTTWASPEAQTEEIAKKIDSKERELFLAESMTGYKDVVDGAESLIAGSPSGASTAIFTQETDAQAFAAFFNEFGDNVVVKTNSFETAEDLKKFVEAN